MRPARPRRAHPTPVSYMEDRNSALDLLEEEVRSCSLCGLARERTRAVPGEGSRKADIMFIGEGPGYYEDQQGRPFVGPAGQLLEQLLASIGLGRSDVYITNMVKCRPPNNRDPLPGEIQACGPYLDRQIELIDPKVIVALGRYSFSKFFPGEAISRARGKPRRWGRRIVFPMYHPAAALRNGRLRPLLEEDFRRLPQLVQEAAQADADQGEQPEQGQQLSFFE